MPDSHIQAINLHWKQENRTRELPTVWLLPVVEEDVSLTQVYREQFVDNGVYMYRKHSTADPEDIRLKVLRNNVFIPMYKLISFYFILNFQLSIPV